MRDMDEGSRFMLLAMDLLYLEGQIYYYRCKLFAVQYMKGQVHTLWEPFSHFVFAFFVRVVVTITSTVGT